MGEGFIVGWDTLGVVVVRGEDLKCCGGVSFIHFEVCKQRSKGESWDEGAIEHICTVLLV